MVKRGDVSIDDLGVRMTDEHAELAHDPDVDHFSADQRVAMWRSLQAQHEDAKKAIHAGQYRPAHDHWCMVIAGDQGDHKTHDMAAILAAMYCRGIDVITNASLMFGVRADAVHIVTFANVMPRHFGMGIDEAHNVASIYRENSDRNYYFVNGLAYARKLDAKVLLASAFDRRISRSAKDAARSVLVPSEAPLPENAQYPPWCYVWDNAIMPFPYSDRGARDEHGMPSRYGRARPMTRGLHSPKMMYHAAKLMDTFETPDLGFALEATAAEIRKALQGDVDAAMSEAEIEAEEEVAAEARDAIVMRAYGAALADASRGIPAFNQPSSAHVALVLQASYGVTEVSAKEIREVFDRRGMLNSRGRVAHHLAQRFWPNMDWDWDVIKKTLK